MSDPAAQAAMLAAIAKAVRAFNAELWTFYTFGVLITILRTYARIKFVGLRGLRADDVIIWVAIVRIIESSNSVTSASIANAGPNPQLLYTTQSTLAYFAVNYGQSYANNSMTPAERLALSPDSTEYHLRYVPGSKRKNALQNNGPLLTVLRVFGSKVQVVGWTTYVCLIGTLKTAVLVFYIRLMEGLSNNFRIRIWIGFGLVGVTFAASFLTIFVSCRPFYNYWQINPDPGNACQGAVASPIVWVTFASSVITDLYLIMIPLPMLWGTSLKLVKKIAATFVLGTGVFVLVCSLLKTVFVSTDPVHGAQLAGAWGTREAFVSVITTNLPMIFPLLKTWLSPIFGSAIYSRATASKHPSGFQTIGGGDGNTTDAGRRRQITASKSQVTSNTSFGGSEERIINDVKMQNLTSSAKPGAYANPPAKGIMVSSEFQIVDNKVSQNGDRNVGIPHESW
ncbi:hypothetical protein LSUB1_G007409 [Lachnellula subtilissima]|uniref:Rhodopsin domain-containing protein n=1 Tax=Lachnellula subtilissima TaxID=602034 RepID=A0A8H8RFW4_9HELO|nr:hypothetical protein LSUB1_G007409 [Lachnellula subtilissima]